MPALFKVYAESEAHRGIRSAIEFAVNRFYAYHEETFVFQSLDAIAHVLALPDIDQAWIIQNVYSLFASLRRNNASSDADMAGIHHANKNEEREALIVITAEEKPQTFFASLRNSGNQNAKALTVELPIEYESKRLEMDDFIRLFLTVIAHDLSIARAQQFLKLLRYLVPSLYEASTSARSVLQEGLNALGSILSRPIPKGKPVELSDTQPERNAFNGMQLADLSNLPSDISSMRIDYLWSLVSFAEVGGRLSADAVRNAFDLAKALLRETPSATTHSSVASFLGAFSKRFMAPKGGRSLKAIIHFLRDLAPIINEHARTIDFTEVFDTIGQLSKNDMYFNDPTFCQLVVAQICGAGLRACNVAALDGLLLSLPSRLSLVSLIVNTVRLPAADIFGELAEVRRPNHNFLALVVLPLALRMKTLAELDLEGAQLDIAQRNLQAQAWSRLLLYVISCCRRTHGPGGDTSPVPERSRSQDKRTSTTGYGSHLPSLLVALQIIKIIIVRAGDDLSWSLPDIWSRLAVFLKEVLEDGNAEFSLRSQEQSPFPSRHLLREPAANYCLWSFLELLCVYRNPLFIQLRAFVHEKVRVLDQELRYHRDSHTPFTSRSRRPSSVFTKPRRRMSNVSGTSSPDASPRLTALAIPDIYQNIPHPATLIPILSRVLITWPTHCASWVSIKFKYFPTFSISRRNKNGTTYFRIRVVQSCMGYQGELLPLPQTSVDTASEVDDLDSPTTAWTKRRALQEVTSETQELLAEFDESLNDLDSVEGIVDEWNLVK
ncbi:hypothetical protein BDP27DRAFT_1455787 [Rhodocollybia butyracea]|uniref:Protein UNC80 C-terminal domain-containing protein n=1 Tax=Rhodocollybia butyracea TaxID=206335 RepID=A0A9P5P5K5_9AGAR|nr:hypothetical protein BDP27DRAFT_1455787 [Rhodocollybia butyracea]